jgi:hypothetical protein
MGLTHLNNTDCTLKKPIPEGVQEKMYIYNPSHILLLLLCLTLLPLSGSTLRTNRSGQVGI